MADKKRSSTRIEGAAVLSHWRVGVTNAGAGVGVDVVSAAPAWLYAPNRPATVGAPLERVNIATPLSDGGAAGAGTA